MSVLGTGPVHADDPFAPAGTVGIWVHVDDRADVDRLRALGLHPEERLGDEIALRVTPDERGAIESLGLSTRAWVYDLPPEGQRAPFTTYAQMVAELQTIATNHPTLTRLAVWGTSVQGRDRCA
jgi:hypothetical protein